MILKTWRWHYVPDEAFGRITGFSASGDNADLYLKILTLKLWPAPVERQDISLNNKFPKKQETNEKLKAKQYGAAALICILVVVIMTIIRLIWGSVMLAGGGNKIPLGMVIFLVRNIVLLFGAIDLVSAICHFILWNRNGQHSMDDDNNGLFSDWKSGERSPVKVSLFLMAGIMVLALALIVQI